MKRTNGDVIRDLHGDADLAEALGMACSCCAYFVGEDCTDPDYRSSNFLVDLLSNQDARILYTTFTDENAEVAMEMVCQRHGIIPPNITILPWFSFLLEHGVRPFQGAAGFGKEKFSGVDLGHEGVNFNKKGTVGYYVNGSNEVYAAKLPELALHCDECSAGAVVGRIKELFDVILIDEIQDMAGYDYDFIAALLHGGISLVMCGDERQSTYRTNTAKKNKGIRCKDNYGNCKKCMAKWLEEEAPKAEICSDEARAALVDAWNTRAKRTCRMTKAKGTMNDSKGNEVKTGDVILSSFGKRTKRVVKEVRDKSIVVGRLDGYELAADSVKRYWEVER